MTESSALNLPSLEISFRGSPEGWVEAESCRMPPRVKASRFRAPLVSFDRHVNRRGGPLPGIHKPTANSTVRSRIAFPHVSVRGFFFPGPPVSRSKRPLRHCPHRWRRRRRRCNPECRLEECGAPVRPLSVFQARTGRTSGARDGAPVGLSRRNSPQGRRRFVTRAGERAVTGREAPQDRCTRGAAIMMPPEDRYPPVLTSGVWKAWGRGPRLLHALPRLLPVHLPRDDSVRVNVRGAFSRKLLPDCFTFWSPSPRVRAYKNYLRRDRCFKLLARQSSSSLNCK